MQSKIIIIILASILSSCGYSNIDIPYFANEADNYIYAAKYIGYRENPIDWPYPKEVVYNGYSDCNGKSALLATMFERNLGYETKLWMCSIKGKKGAHMIVEANGKYYESTSMYITEKPNEHYNLVNWMSLETYMTIADLMHPFD